MKDFIDLIEDSGVKKKIIFDGQGENTPKLGQKIEYLYTARLNDSIGPEFGTMYEYVVMREDPFTKILGEGQLLKGLEIGLQSMKKGEKAFIYITPPYAFGDNGLEPKVPPNMTVIYEIELIDFYDFEKTKWDYKLEEKIEIIKTFKEKGNELFKQNNFMKAKEQYAKAWDLIEMETRPSIQNLNFVSIKLNNYELGKYFADEAITMDSSCSKAYYRKGTCEFNLNLVRPAYETLKTAQKLNDENKEIRNFLKLVENVLDSNQI